MKTTRPEQGLERVLAALEQDLLNATDEEIQTSAKELGMNPNMKGSAAMFGVTLLLRPRSQEKNTRPRSKKASGVTATVRSRRRSKGDAP